MSERRSPIPVHVWLRVTLLVAVVTAGFAVLRMTPLGDAFTQERVVGALTSIRAIWWAPAVLVGLYGILAPLGLPMTPLIIGGAVFGAAHGSLYNMVGLFLGAATSYHLARFLGRDFVVRLSGARIRRAERLFERHGFWPLVQTRFLPIPFPLVNFGAALAGIPGSLFLLTTVVGVVPSTLLHTFFISRMIENTGTERLIYGAGYLATFVFFNLAIAVPWIGEQLQRRRRYRDLIAHRARRARRDTPTL
jgi:uncharacterized membrane protein YdjX (TVP38/TMEM64 family)